jgi:hypothetical protein
VALSQFDDAGRLPQMYCAPVQHIGPLAPEVPPEADGSSQANALGLHRAQPNVFVRELETIRSKRSGVLSNPNKGSIGEWGRRASSMFTASSIGVAGHTGGFLFPLDFPLRVAI